MPGRVGSHGARGRFGNRLSGATLGATFVLLCVFPVGLTSAAGASTAAALNQEPPQVVGLPLDEAEQLIARDWYPSAGPYDLQFEITPDVPAQVDPTASIVVAQEVVLYLEDSDDVSPAATMRLTVGSRVPDLRGLSFQDALDLVEPLGLGLEASGVEDGVVIRQSPEAAALLPYGDGVRVYLAAAPPSTALVPNLVGLTEALAQAAVADAGLTYEVVSASGTGERRVSTQSPASGVVVELATTVGVTLQGTVEGRQTVVVPDVTGLSPADVAKVLGAVPLRLKVDATGDGSQGLAARQAPAPGSQVAPGAFVTVAFAVVPAPQPKDTFPWVPVSLAAAAVVVAAAGLALRVHTRTSRQPAVRFEPRRDDSPVVSTRATSDEVNLVVGVEPHPDPGHVTLEEERT
jgi:beta-lactam-binding protein with PASTA domain